MSWIILSVLLLLGAGAAWRGSSVMGARSASGVISNDRFGDPRESHIASLVLRGVAIACAAGWLLLTVLSTFTIVSPGYVGLVKTFGDYSSQIRNGFNAVPPWSDVQTVSIQVQREEFDRIEAFSSETQDVFVSATLNYSLSPSAVRKLYTEVGSDWFRRIVPSRVQQTVKEETVKYRAVDEAPNRAKISQNIEGALRRALDAYSIDVAGFQIRDITFDPSFTESILAKQRATQDALTAKNRVAEARAQAEQKVELAKGQANSNVAIARGRAEATLVEATAQAKANRLLAQSVTDALIRYTAVQKLAPGVRTVLLPADSNLILPSSVAGK